MEVVMKKVFATLTITAVSIMFMAFTPNEPAAEGNKFIGAKSCGMCHKSKTGNQDKIWKESKHAKAFTALSSEEGKKIAAANGIEDATTSEKCLSCHATASAEKALWDKKFKVDAGVQCESCHGAGSGYKSKKIMLDHAKSVAGGMTDFTVAGSAEKVCANCHSGEQPKDHPNKEFKFAESWAKIQHPVPAK